MKVTILGCGTSSGVPRIGNDWGRCDPNDPRNRRRRVSVLFQAGGHDVLVDTGPDFREQVLDAGLTKLDAVFYSHAHSDHAHGIDDLRQFFHLMSAPVDCHATEATWAELKPRFRYVFEGGSGYPPSARAHLLNGPVTIGPMTVRPFEQIHGPIKTVGFRVEANGRAACYSTDLNDLTLSADQAVRGCDLWIVDCLRRKPHPTHAHLERTLSWIDRLRPSRAILTHMDNSMDYMELSRELPRGVEPGYDMLTVKL